MRVVGYVRESPDPSDGRSGFAQQEEIRRYAATHGLSVVAVCQDLRGSADRDGYLSLLGVVAAGGVDAVLLPGIATLSGDQIVQEIMIWDLLGRGIRVVSTAEQDAAFLGADADPGAARMLIRDVLTRVGEHARSIGARRIDPPSILPDGDVLIHILDADAVEANRTV
ncbi:MAG: recombinase family protein [Acidimicrobiia bacterium]|nr:recombinase family protein [Acidimicrobiia bacterium]